MGVCALASDKETAVKNTSTVSILQFQISYGNCSVFTHARKLYRVFVPISTLYQTSAKLVNKKTKTKTNAAGSLFVCLVKKLLAVMSEQEGRPLCLELTVSTHLVGIW